MRRLDYVIGALEVTAGILMFFGSVLGFIVFARGVVVVLDGNMEDLFFTLVSGISTAVLTVGGIRQVWHAGRYPRRHIQIEEVGYQESKSIRHDA